MDKALYIAMSGAKNNMLGQVAHANNLANLNTVGFKADFAQARSMPVYYGDGQPTRAYALTESPATDFKQGPLVETGRDLDVAIEGEGFIAVQAPDGTEAYTRAGSLFVDSVGMLRTGNGLPVMGNGGPIAIPAAEKLEVAVDGTITAIPLGQGVDSPVQVDRIKLVNPGLDNIKKMEDGLVRTLTPAEDVPADAGVRLISRFVEGSNVNAVNEMVEVMNLARQYEMQVKIMQTVKEDSEASARLLQMNG
ncbi:flagellar basal-body rod protein FlgF [Teredinibacter waterburyi]|jgi:flagellar basal-body rod protein FlgF|uniref:flagellar basal-body rod protein FlgF n=1 Tax=Teredinibacter waterburyi TaxID=1500538 RepID=UPI00165F57AC|nr:flagellar basal-body rod protein FlgF [Teredinibacter waterburyi]